VTSWVRAATCSTAFLAVDGRHDVDREDCSEPVRVIPKAPQGASPIASSAFPSQTFTQALAAHAIRRFGLSAREGVFAIT
jgi:hypothetical protein